MHEVASRAGVARYLMLMKTYAGNWLEVAHRSQSPDKNYDFLRRYGLLLEDVRDILTSLVADDYSDGPCCDDKQLGRPDVWKFGKTVELEGEELELYIKTSFGYRADGMGCVCVSIHPCERPLSYPLKEGRS